MERVYSCSRSPLRRFLVSYASKTVLLFYCELFLKPFIMDIFTRDKCQPSFLFVNCFYFQLLCMWSTKMFLFKKKFSDLSRSPRKIGPHLNIVSAVTSVDIMMFPGRLWQQWQKLGEGGGISHFHVGVNRKKFFLSKNCLSRKAVTLMELTSYSVDSRL